MIKGYTQQDHIAAWRAKFDELLAQYQEHYSGGLPKPDLYRLIDGCDHILFPLVNAQWHFNATHHEWNFNRRHTLRKDKELRKAEDLEYLTARKHLASAARVALTAWFLDDESMQSWKDNDQAATYIATAWLIRQMQETDVGTLLVCLKLALPKYLPERRRAAWQKYVG